MSTKNNNDEVVTRGMLDGAVDAILKGMDNVAGSLKEEMNNGFGKVGEELGEVKREIKFMRNDINDLKIDTPIQKEFNDLKKRVDHFAPQN